MKKCKKDQTDIAIFLIKNAKESGDQERYMRFIKSAKMRRNVDFNKVQKCIVDF